MRPSSPIPVLSWPGRRLLSVAAAIQGIYYLTTGLWAVVSIDSFQKITGPKSDLWLVKTVGLLVAVSGGVFLLTAVRRRFPLEVLVLAVGSCMSLAAIGLVYVPSGIISPVYLLDSLTEFLLAALWLIGWLKAKRKTRS